MIYFVYYYPFFIPVEMSDSVLCAKLINVSVGCITNCISAPRSSSVFDTGRNTLGGVARGTLHAVPHKSGVSRLIQLGLRDMKFRRHWELANGLGTICHRLLLRPIPSVARTRDFDYTIGSVGLAGQGLSNASEELSKASAISFMVN